MQPIISASKQVPNEGPRRDDSLRGFTLVEVMVATVLLSMVILGILSVLIGSYRMAAKARYADHARYVVKSFADQFLTQQPLDAYGETLPLFWPTMDTGGNSTPLGTGLTWTNANGLAGTLSSDQHYYYVYLGDTSGAPITASVSRTVWYVYDNTGQPTLIVQSKSAGYLLRGDFTISYSYLNQAMPPLTVSVIRSVP